MSTFAQLKSQVALNLNDSLGVFYDINDLRDSFQDAYTDVAVLTNCIVKKVTVPFQTSPYYDFAASISDFLAVTAIFNIDANLWLQDDQTLKSFDLMRDDWEIWNGTPQFWAPVNFKYTAIVPSYVVLGQSMDLYYWANAPTIVDTDVPLIPTDLQKLLEFYTTPDLLEQAEEFAKAETYWETYYALIEKCANRFKNYAKADLLRLA